jgi:hypothetical protein
LSEFQIADFFRSVDFTDMKHFLVSLALLTALNTTWANLGDNGDRIEDLYANIVERHLRDDGTVTVLYQKDRYSYFVIFANEHSILERYSHANGTGLSEKEIARFLKANAGAATWTPDSKATERRFERSDHRAEATYGDVNGRPTLTVRALGKGQK